MDPEVKPKLRQASSWAGIGLVAAAGGLVAAAQALGPLAEFDGAFGLSAAEWKILVLIALAGATFAAGLLAYWIDE